MINVTDQIGALGPRYALQFEALSALQHQVGSARMLEHALAHPAEDETVRIVALALSNAALAVNLMAELVRAQRSGKAAKVEKVRRRLDRVLAAAKARALATCDA